MKRRIPIIIIVIVIVTVWVVRWEKPKVALDQPAAPSAAQGRVWESQSYPARQTNALGDILTDAQDPEFVSQVFPILREFFVTLDRLGINPMKDEVRPDSCSKIRIISIPDGKICRLVVGDGWTATCAQNSTYSGIMQFGQRGPDNPIRAISHADTKALRRLSLDAIHMPKADAWQIANRVADAFTIDRSKFEEPEMYEEALFEYRLGIQSVRYRKKGSDPVNQLNYTRSFSLKATSPTTAVLVSYSHLDAR